MGIVKAMHVDIYCMVTVISSARLLVDAIYL